MTAVVIDDEQSSHDIVGELLKHLHPEIKAVGHAYNVESGIELVNRKVPDMLFLDIQMPDGTGFDLLEKVEYHRFAIIFISGHEEYARTAIEFQAMAYLDKPVASEKLTRAIEDAKKRLTYRNFEEQTQDFQSMINDFRQKKPPTRLSVSNNTGFHYIPIENIKYLKVDKGCTMIYSLDYPKVSVSNNLVEYEERLAPYGYFMRVHRSFILNAKQVSSLSNDTATLFTEETIPVSRRHHAQLRDLLDEL